MNGLFKQPKNTLPSIECLYAFVSVDTEDGNEGLVAAPIGPVGCMPLVAADMKRLEQLTPIAQWVADQARIKIRLIKLSKREVIMEINPSLKT